MDKCFFDHSFFLWVSYIILIWDHISGKLDATHIHLIRKIILFKSTKSICSNKGQSDDSMKYTVEISIPSTSGWHRHCSNSKVYCFFKALSRKHRNFQYLSLPVAFLRSQGAFCPSPKHCQFLSRCILTAVSGYACLNISTYSFQK